MLQADTNIKIFWQKEKILIEKKGERERERDEEKYKGRKNRQKLSIDARKCR